MSDFDWYTVITALSCIVDSRSMEGLQPTIFEFLRLYQNVLSILGVAMPKISNLGLRKSINYQNDGKSLRKTPVKFGQKNVNIAHSWTLLSPKRSKFLKQRCSLSQQISRQKSTRNKTCRNFKTESVIQNTLANAFVDVSAFSWWCSIYSIWLGKHINDASWRHHFRPLLAIYDNFTS